MIIESLESWEPRIAVQDVDVWTGTGFFDEPNPLQEDIPEDEGHILGIKITFVDPQDIKNVQELVLKMPIGGT